MASLGRNKEKEFLTEYAKTNEVIGTIWEVESFIEADKGFLITFLDCPFLHFVFFNSSIAKSIEAYFSKDHLDPKEFLVGYPLLLKIHNEKGTDIELMTDTKEKRYLSCKPSTSGKNIYTMSGLCLDKKVKPNIK